MESLRLKATGTGTGEIKISYDSTTETLSTNIYEFNVVITSSEENPNEYNGTPQTIAKLTSKSEDIKHYSLGYYKEDSESNIISWVDDRELKVENVGKYHIYKRFTTDNDIPTNDNDWVEHGIEIGIAKIEKAEASAESKELEDIEYSKDSQEVKLEVKDATGDDVTFPEYAEVNTSKGVEKWICKDGILTVPARTKWSYTYEITLTVNIAASDNYNSGTKTLTWELYINRNPAVEIHAEDDLTILEYDHSDYVRLDDDVSFQIVRTNPKLTTNTKLLYDGKDMYMEAYHAEPILSTVNYKNRKIYSTGLFNKDLRKFLLGTDMSAYTVGQDVRDTIILDNFDNQFENMYWCGVESINSDVYPQEMGCIAPLYLKKKRPNYFVIFKIDTPANTNLVEDKDINYDFKKDILEKAKIIKAFDLREGTPIGNYIKRYVEQKNFEYDRSIYINFSSNEIYYYGIDKSSGVLVQKVENFEQQLLHNDNTIMKMDDWITSGFERNNLIFPYIINFEFLFDDKETNEYEFARYFGMYCNDIDLYDVDITNMKNNDNSTDITVNWGEGNFKMPEDNFYYIKDKNKNIFTLKDYPVPDCFSSPSKLDSKDFMGFELDSVSAYAERIPGIGHSIMVFEIYNKFNDTDTFDILKRYSEDVFTIFKSFTVNTSLEAGEFEDDKFSNKGDYKDIAKAIAGAINDCDKDEFKWIRAYSIDNKVVMEAVHSGSSLNGLFDVDSSNIRKLTDEFIGGNDVNGCMFKVYTEDKDIFFNSEEITRSNSRYLKCGDDKNNAEILSFIPYIHNRVIDDTYSLLITDNNGRYVNVSGTNQVEIVDKFYTKVGVLSFFPVKDFDFDTVSSAYGNGDMMQKELDTVNQDIEIEYYGNDKDTILHMIDIPYGKFFYKNGNNIDTEYEYFFENIIPELCTVNKTVPYIAKWGYIDDSKDSCENVYRLNTSKIFETCNFSANTFSKNGDILEYTHSMPYYINNAYCSDFNEDNYKNEYQYIPVSPEMWELSTGKKTVENKDSTKSEDDVLDTWINYFLNENENNFEKMFGDTSIRVLKNKTNKTTYFSNKRFNKKYSRFLLGNKVNRSSTLFRGVKFEIEELENGKETHTGKFNDYKFSFIYIPVWNIEDNKYTVHFVKNDKYKFIVGFVLFDVKTNLKYREFNKAYVYAGSMSYIEKDKKEDTQDVEQQGGEQENTQENE